MKQRCIAVLTAAMLLLQLLSLPAAALYEQAASGVFTAAEYPAAEEKPTLVESEPAEPAEPAEPVESEPAEPAEPAEPVESEPAEPAEPAEPVESEPAEPEPAEPEPAEPDPAEPESTEPDEAEPGASIPGDLTEGVVAGTVAGIAPLWSAWGPYTTAAFSYGLNVNPGNGNLLDCAIGLTTGAELRVELTEECAAIPGVSGDPTIASWIAYWRTGSVGISDGAPPDAALLHFSKLGNPGEIRVPDKQFGGWYVYPDTAAVSDRTKWFYSAGCVDRVEPDPPGGDTLVITDDYPSIAGQMSRALPLVGRWVDSARAELRAEDTKILPMRGAVADSPVTELYTDDIGTGSLSGKTPIAFQTDVHEYYLRVDSGVTALNMTLAAFEPYYTYFKTQYGTAKATAASPVKAKVTYGAAETDLTAGFLGGNAKMMPAPTIGGGGTAGVPNNTRAAPARSDWTVTVPLEKCAGAGKLYNDIVVTITAPDGTVGTYTFHIQRLAEPLLRLNPGNTPFGMIERDTSALWGSTPDLKDAAKAFFRENKTFNFAQNRYPMDTVHNNGGSIMRKTYQALAWGGGATNYDYDPTAIVVYQNSAFLDPGITGLTDALGRTGASVGGVVRRTIALRTAEKLTLDLIRKDSGTPVYYRTMPGGGGALVPEPTTETLRTESGGGVGDVVDLRGWNVLPGIYSIEYSYEDAAADKIYDSDPGKFASDKENANSFRRALIVLPIPGDVDMDGMVTPADAAALRVLGGMTGSTTATTRLNGIQVTTGDPVVDVMFYRVCDVTGEGICNIGTESATGDVLVLQGGYLPQLTRGGESDYYYIPLPDGGASYPRRELIGSEPAGANAGQLTLHYLGTQKGVKNAQGFYPSPVAEPIYDGTVPETDRVQQGDIFWMGVKLTDVDKSGLTGSGISAFTMTLTYDGNYVQPVDVLQEGDISTGGGSVDFWTETIKKYNIGSGARTIWGTTGRYEVPTFGLNKARNYLTHYTKAITPLEKSVPSGLRELVFSIRLKDGSAPAELDDGWLLVVPFKLTQFPYDRENPVLVEMGAGMREFLFTGTGPMAETFSGAGPMTAAVSGIGDGALLAGETATAAYSAQDSIYGGTTRNLRDKMKYTEGVGAAIPVGDDNSPAILLSNTNVSGRVENARYGESFRSAFVNGLLDAATPLPPGLQHGSGANAFITGTPTQAGDYTFRVGGIKYQIIVEPAEIRFYVANQSSYYGQPEFRGDNNPYFAGHYYYYTSDIKQVDRDRVGTVVEGAVVQNTGRGDALRGLLGGSSGGYVQPKFRAVVSTGETPESITAETRVGTYAVVCPTESLPRATNYVFRFVDESPGGASVGVNRLTITPRPVTVTKLTLDSANGEYVATIYDNNSEHVNMITAEYNLAAGKRQFAMAPISTSGTYAGLPLSGDAFIGDDSLSISYTAVYQRTQEDINVGPIGKRFSIVTPWGWDTREVLVKDIRVIVGADSGNYQLIQGEENRPTGIQDPPVLGKVQAQIITAIEITSMPASMVYGYGDYLGSGTITFKFIYAGGTEKTGIQLNESSWGAYGVTPRWVTEEEMNRPGEMGDEEYTLNFSERLTVFKHNGRYLCLSVMSWDESTRDEEGNMQPIVIQDYSGRLTVNKKVITVTAKPVERYYGEENPAAFDFTYDTATMAAFDRKTGDKGNASELLDGRPGMAGYQPPVLRAVEALTGDRATVPVTGATSASASSYYITIAGAVAANYSFVYKEGTAGTTSAVRGYAALTIQRRPIVVQDILSSISAPKEIGQIDGSVVTSYQPPANATGVSLATIYSDTKDLVVSRTKNPNCQYNGNTLRLTPTGAKEFSVGLPTHTPAGTQYYPAGGSGSSPLSFAMTFASGASAVVDNDELALTYTATFVPDLAFHLGFANNHFDMTQADANTGERICDVQVSGMALTGAAAGNYQLVYQRNDDAVNGYPYLREAKLAPQLGRNDSPTVYYYVSGHGVLRTRAISNISIVTVPQMIYTYGEQFAPDMAAAGGRYPLTIQVDYDTAYDNAANNITGEQLMYESYGYDHEGTLMTNFRDRRMEIRYLPVGETDRTKSKPLELGDYLSVAEHDGKQILVAGRRSERDTPVYSMPASERLTVYKKNLPIVIQNQSRYYGERNADYVFTFQRSDLAVPDRAWLSGAVGTCRAVVTTDGPAAGLVATEGDLKGNGGYVGPRFTTGAQTTSGVRTTGDGAYALTLAGGSMDNYNLVPTGGDGKIVIYPRPVVVMDIHSSISAPDRIGRIDGTVVTSYQPASGVSGVSLANIYSDTKDLAVTAAAANANCKYNGNTLRLSPTVSEFQVELPTHSPAGTEYYPSGGASNPVTSSMTFASGAAALVGNDELALTYTATFVPELAFHSGVVNNYFDMSQADADTGERFCDVQVSNLKLTGASAANYQLVYLRNDNAISGYPHNRVPKRAPQLGLYDSPTVYYYVSGHGVLHTRNIVDISIVTLPQMTYTYGEQFAPHMPKAGGTAPLSIQVNYATTYDNAANNITGERMDFNAGLFRDRFMELRYLPAGETDVARSKPLEAGEYLTVKDHNSRRILVAGKRFARDALTYSQPSSEPLTVYKKDLPLIVQNQYRYYGERNADYTFTFKKSDLAVPDRGWFTAADGVCWAVVNHDGPAAGLPAAEGDLKGRGNYVAPQFTTVAQTTSDVLNSGKTPYVLTLAGGSMDNYNLVPTGGPGEIYIYRRPIKVTTVISSEENPVFGVYSDTRERVFDSDKDLSTLPPILPVAAGQRYDNSGNDPEFQKAPNAGLGLPLTAAAVLPGDSLSFAIKVTYPDYDSEILLEGDALIMPVHVTAVELHQNAGAGKNYCLLPDNYNMPATGLVQLRRINSIRLVDPVRKTDYQYPEALDLGGLVVEITYASLSSEPDWVEQVRYVGTTQYAAYGLYTRYTDQPRAPETMTEIDALYQAGRKAESGDHLTIAPTQDTQGGAPFAANGKYLTVIARRHQAQTFANAIIANPGAPIQVAPLPIQFTLAADGKTYDGTTRAVGTLTMHNIFNESAAVDQYHPEGVTDVVFAVTGAENQTPAPGFAASDHRGYEALKSSLRNDGYRFTTGVYVRDEANRLNDRLEFTGGVYGGVADDRLTFVFLEHNVAYLEPPVHDSYGALTTIGVEARRMILAGPDAANYTLVTAVTADNCEDAEGYQSDALPRATIYKAARPALTATLQSLGNPGAGLRPTAQLDERTNAVRAEYGMDIALFAVGHDDYKGEDHFEFALQYDGSEDGAARVGQWAGQTGTQRYQDTRFFGGEFVTVDVPPDYRASPSDIPAEYDPERDVLLGQPYGWNGLDPDVSVYIPGYLRAVLEGGALSPAPYPGYEVYQGTRRALPRDMVLWALVRLAETHNYEASPALSSVPGMDDTLIASEAAAAAALNEAQIAYLEEQITETQLRQAEQAARTAAEKLLAAVGQTVQDTKRVAAERSALFPAIVEGGRWPEEGLPALEPGPAVKTFRQRIDLVSTGKRRSSDTSDPAEYVIPRLETVWFTDILEYADRRLFNAVVRDFEKPRYYEYFWDADFSAKLKLDDSQDPLSLETAFEVEMLVWQGGESLRTNVTVNQEPVDGVPTDNTARVYVDLVFPSGSGLHWLRVVPGTVTARLGDQPMQLVVEFNPSDIKRRLVKWSTSDPAVVTVDEYGLIAFTGVGAAVITATAYNGMTSTSAITVLDKSLTAAGEWEREMMEIFPNAIFNFALQEPFAAVDTETLFYPEREMTRGDLAIFMAQFYRENLRWTRSGSGNFPDLTGEEPYAAAARLMGELGVMVGVDDGSFAGARKVTRAEAVTVLARMLFMEVPDTTGQPHAFLDTGEQDTWAYSYIDAMSLMGIVQGVGDGYFRPGRIVIRAEAATMVDRLLCRVIDPGETGIIIPADVAEGHWAYLPILRAVNDTGREEQDPI